MSTLTIQMPESLARQLRECAAKEGLTVDQLLSSAAAEKLSALMTLEHLRQRALRAKREDFTNGILNAKTQGLKGAKSFFRLGVFATWRLLPRKLSGLAVESPCVDGLERIKK